MTFTTASGLLLPAGIAVYVQRGPNGVGLEMGYPAGLEGITSQSETRRSNSLLPASQRQNRELHAPDNYAAHSRVSTPIDTPTRAKENVSSNATVISAPVRL